MSLHLVGVEDFLHALELNQRRTVAGHRLSYLLILTRSTLSHCDMSDRITESRTFRPRITSIVLTELRPTCTCTRVEIGRASCRERVELWASADAAASQRYGT